MFSRGIERDRGMKWVNNSELNFFKSFFRNRRLKAVLVIAYHKKDTFKEENWKIILKFPNQQFLPKKNTFMNLCFQIVCASQI